MLQKIAPENYTSTTTSPRKLKMITLTATKTNVNRPHSALPFQSPENLAIGSTSQVKVKDREVTLLTEIAFQATTAQKVQAVSYLAINDTKEKITPIARKRFSRYESRNNNNSYSYNGLTSADELVQ